MTSARSATSGILIAAAVVLLLWHAVALAKPADSPASSARLQWGYTPTEIGWYYTVGGDFDQNGEVNYSDVTALGQHFGEVADRGFFIEGTIQALIDADHNGEINFGDLVAIGANFGADAQGGFDVYRDGAVAGHVDFADGAVTEHGARLFYTFELDDDNWNEVYVVPVDGAGNPGAQSTSLGYQEPPVPFIEHFDVLSHMLYYTLPPLSHDGAELHWYYDNNADYDQDGMVEGSAQEATLVKYWFYSPKPWGYGSIESVLDGDNNEEINSADIGAPAYSVFAHNRMAAGFFVYSSTNGYDIPAISNWVENNLDSAERIAELTVPSLVEPIAYIPFIEFQGDPRFERIWFTYVVPNPDPDAWYWVRPVVHGKVGAFTEAIKGSNLLN